VWATVQDALPPLRDTIRAELARTGERREPATKLGEISSALEGVYGATKPPSARSPASMPAPTSRPRPPTSSPSCAQRNQKRAA